MKWLAAGALAALAGAGCGVDEPPSLLVDLQTDYRVPDEFTIVRTVVHADDADEDDLVVESSREVDAAADFSSGARVAEIPLASDGEHTARIELLGGDGSVARARVVRVAVRGRTVVRVTILRADVDCESDLDCMSIGCLAGRCLDGRCEYGASDVYCAVGECCNGATLGCDPVSCCDDGNPCTEDVRDFGVCVARPVADGSPCAAGVCYGGVCCPGCWTGTACLVGDQVSACGQGGGACRDCGDRNACTADRCQADGTCGHQRLSGDRCAGGGGICRNGDCCSGCWDGTRCRTGSAKDYCGDRGRACQNCPDACLGGTCF